MCFANDIPAATPPTPAATASPNTVSQTRLRPARFFAVVDRFVDDEEDADDDDGPRFARFDGGGDTALSTPVSSSSAKTASTAPVGESFGSIFAPLYFFFKSFTNCLHALDEKFVSNFSASTIAR